MIIFGQREKKYWKALLQNREFTKQLTNNLQNELYNKVETLANYDFTIENIEELKKEVSTKIVCGVEKTIIELFDTLSRKHSWCKETSKNIHYFNGWKTNQSWKINKKVILPLNWQDSFARRLHPDSVDVDYSTRNKLTDIEKALMFLDRNKIDTETSVEHVCMAMKQHSKSKGVEFRYFTADFYKKGTVHLTFKDEALLHRFNIFGCQYKKWLPPSYSKKSYEELDAGERDVIDSFEGEQSYREVCSHSDLLFDAAETTLCLV
jgi:hypothetical protein